MTACFSTQYERRTMKLSHRGLSWKYEKLTLGKPDFQDTIA